MCLKEYGDGGVFVVLIGEKKGKEESDALHFCSRSGNTPR